MLALMVEGLNNTQIAGRLTVSPSTVKSHVSNILSKLGVSSRTEAVTWRCVTVSSPDPLDPSHLPQVAETNTPQPMDVAGECLL